MKIIDVINIIKDNGYYTNIYIGNVFDNLYQEVKYPLLNIDINNINIGNVTTTYNITIYAVDKLLNDNTNYVYIIQDNEYYMTLLKKKLENCGLITDDVIILTPFTEKFSANCSGVFMNLNIKVENDVGCE